MTEKYSVILAEGQNPEASDSERTREEVRASRALPCATRLRRFWVLRDLLFRHQ